MFASTVKTLWQGFKLCEKNLSNKFKSLVIHVRLRSIRRRFQMAVWFCADTSIRHSLLFCNVWDICPLLHIRVWHVFIRLRNDPDLLWGLRCIFSTCLRFKREISRSLCHVALITVKKDKWFMIMGIRLPYHPSEGWALFPRAPSRSSNTWRHWERHLEFKLVFS